MSSQNRVLRFLNWTPSWVFKDYITTIAIINCKKEISKVLKCTVLQTLHVKPVDFLLFIVLSNSLFVLRSHLPGASQQAKKTKKAHNSWLTQWHPEWNTLKALMRRATQWSDLFPCYSSSSNWLIVKGLINLVWKANCKAYSLFQGYFRRAEVEAASGLYDEAVISYTRALQLDPHNVKLMESIKSITDEQQRKIKGTQL